MGGRVDDILDARLMTYGAICTHVYVWWLPDRLFVPLTELTAERMHAFSK